MFYEQLTEFAGRKVIDFFSDPEPAGQNEDAADLQAATHGAAIADPGSVAWRLEFCSEWLDFPDLLAKFLDQVPTAEVRALVTGQWNEFAQDDSPVVEELVAVADRLPALRSLFVNDLCDEQSQPSWIYVPQVGPLLDAFPALEELWVRGTPEGFISAEGIKPLIPPTKHAALRTLVFQSGGLPASTIRDVAECDFPELTHLEFYLGDPNYGGDATIADLAPLLEAGRFPNLRHLGLRDSVIQDEVAAAVAQAPVVAQLESLDLSLGTLGDEGAAALLAGQPLGHLRALNLSHHYITPEMQRRMRGAWPDVRIDFSEEQDAEERDRRYIAVAE